MNVHKGQPPSPLLVEGMRGIHYLIIIRKMTACMYKILLLSVCHIIIIIIC